MENIHPVLYTYRVSQKKMWLAAPGAKLYPFCATLLYGVFTIFFVVFLILQWPKKIHKPFFLSKSKIQKNKNVLRKYCFSMILKVSTEERIFNTLEYAKKKLGQVNLNNFSWKIRPELKIANLLISILQIFCDSLVLIFVKF